MDKMDGAAGSDVQLAKTAGTVMGLPTHVQYKVFMPFFLLSSLWEQTLVRELFFAALKFSFVVIGGF